MAVSAALLTEGFKKYYIKKECSFVLKPHSPGFQILGQEFRFWSGHVGILSHPCTSTGGGLGACFPIEIFGNVLRGNLILLCVAARLLH